MRRKRRRWGDEGGLVRVCMYILVIECFRTYRRKILYKRRNISGNLVTYFRNINIEIKYRLGDKRISIAL